MFKNVCVSVLVFLSVLLITGISLAEPPKEITVSAAMSLKDAFEEIGRLYEAKNKATNKGANIIFNFASSGALRRQIEVGAPVNVFASASQKDMDIIEQKGMVIKDTRVNFAANSIVLIVPAESKAEIKSFKDLISKNIKRIAIGNPNTVPAGRYVQEVLNYYKVAEAIKDRLIFAENVRQVLDYVAREEVDAGIIYLTDAMVRPKEVKIAATAGEASHSPAVYPIAVVKGTRNEILAKEFISLVTSPEGKKILEKYGFKAVR